MAKPPEFSHETIRILSERSAMICNNPSCATITVGPSDARGDLAIKLGEAAHIRAKNNGARFDASMNDVQRADISNGIWLCSNCHTMVDKNNGADFSPSQLEGWKRQHEEMIRILLVSHRSPIPYLRKYTEEGIHAQEAVDTVARHGAFIADMSLENGTAVIISIDKLRDEIKAILAHVQLDLTLKSILHDLYAHLRTYMNETSKFPAQVLPLLPALRFKVGVVLARLREEYGCVIGHELLKIIPS